MNVREYYSQIEGTIRNCSIVTHFSIDLDEIDQHIGYLKGELELIDGTVLHFIEFIEIQRKTANRLKYKYHLQSENGDLIRRWDNVPHHQEIDTFPNHMHDEKGVHASSNIDLKTIIDKIIDEIMD